MLKPLRSKGNQAKIAQSTTLKAPVQGWYVGTNISDAPPGTALVLDNCYSQYNYIRLRRGSVQFASGMGANKVTVLAPYVSGTTTKFFAFANGSIYDVSAGGAVGAAVVSGLNASAVPQATAVSVTGGQYLVWSNGVDSVRNYDGTVWTTPAITGVASSSLYGQFVHKSRTYFIQANTLNCWYLPVDSIAGAATVFNLQGVVKRGGSLLCGYSWAISSNSGLYEVAVFITDQGDLAIYDGSYPGSTDWALKGTYQISKPLGRNCLMKAGGDLAVMTEDGIIALSTIMELDQLALQNQAVTKAIQPAWRDAVTARLGLSGWSITPWALETMIVVNLPQSNSADKQQFIANARSGAWSRYTGWDAQCFAVFGNNLYYGTSDGRVMQAESGGQDDGQPYTGICMWSYTDLGTQARRKQIRMIRPILLTSLTTAPTFQILKDFSTNIGPAPSASASLPGSGFQWDTASHGWDQDVWSTSASGTTLITSASWRSVNGYGTVLAPVMQISVSGTTAPDVRMTQIDLLYEPGEVFG